MPNLYTRLANIKADLGMTGATYDAVLLRLIEDVSRAIDDETQRRFYSLLAQTRVYDGPPAPKSVLWLPDDLISITTLKVDEDGDLIYEKTLAADTDYFLWPDNKLTHDPYTRIDINPQSTNVWAFPTGRRRIQLIGVFGYSNETELTTTTLNEDLDNSETGVDEVDGAAASAGETVVIDSEQMYISSVATNTWTLVRGVNGSTAATHSSGAAVYRRRYARPIERATGLQVVRLYREQQTGGGGMVGGEQLGGFVFSGLYPAIRDLIAPYRKYLGVY